MAIIPLAICLLYVWYAGKFGRLLWEELRKRERDASERPKSA